jgi:hypothetical protein
MRIKTMNITTQSSALRAHSRPQAKNAAPAPQDGSATREVTFSYNPQDQLVFEPGTLDIPGVKPDGSTARFVQDAPLPAGKDGNYVYDKADPSFHGANAFAAAQSTLNIFEKANGEAVKWSRTDRLVVHGDEGRDLNAYYDGQGLHFFHYPVEGKMVFSGDSGEVVGHETGHAILDGLRPAYLHLWGTEPGAFHESFGDVLAMLASLKNERVLNRVLEQTGGDLSKDNVSAALGEELGVAINKVSGENATGGDYTRNAINSFTYQDPSTLPRDGGPDELHPEVHDFSRLWTGAFYEIFTGIVNRHIAEGMDARSALSTAADEGLKMYADLFKKGYAPQANFKYPDMAAALVKSENDHNGGKYTDLISKVMTARKMLPEGSLDQLTSAPAPTGTRQISTTLEGDRFGQFAGARVETTLNGEAGLQSEDNREAAQLQNDLARLISAGEIKMTEPNQVVQQKDLFKADGKPYTGVVRWIDGQMAIERVPIVS